MTVLWREFKYAARLLSRNLGFTLTIVVVLALGIGANIAIFNVIDAVMLKKLPVKDPQQLVMLRWSSSRQIPKDILKQAFGNDKNSLFSMSTYEFIQQRQQGLANLFAFADASGGPARILVKVKNRGILANGTVVTGTYFPTLGIQPAIGRLISPDDDHPSSIPVIVISYPFWSRTFAKAPSTIGQTILIQGSPFTIVGVTPPDFFGVQPGQSPDFWEPISQWDGIKDTMENMGADRSASTTWWLTIVGRSKPNVSTQQIRSEMSVLFRQSLEANLNSHDAPDSFPNLVIVAADRGTSDLRQKFSHPLLTLMSVVALGLLIACGSVGLMVLARTRSRNREMSVRLALGATRTLLTQQLLIEIVFLVGISTIIGGALAYWASHAIMKLISGYVGSLGFVVRPNGPDVSVFLFSAGLAALTGIICGLLPARLTMHIDVASMLKEGHGFSESGHRAQWISGGKFLVMLQVAISLLVLIGAGLFIRTIENLEHQDLGFNSNNLLVFDVNAPVDGYQNAALAELYQRITERIQNLPGVVSATSSTAPLISPWFMSVPITLLADGQHADRTTIPAINMVGPSFFETMEIPIVRGRSLTSADQNSSKKVAIANEAFVDHFFAGGNPIGQRFTFGQVAISNLSYELVGVAENAKYKSVSDPASPMIYIPYSQFAGLLNHLPVGMHFEVRTQGDTGALIPSLHAAIHDIDPGLPLNEVKTQVEQIDSSLAQERVLALLSGILGLFVLLLAATSVYGIQSHVVAKRKYEIGIRMALGANRHQVLWMIWWQSLAVACAGAAVGLGAALLLTRLIGSQLYGVKPTDPATIVCATTMLIIMAMIGGYLPAKKATDIDPARTLRQV